MCPQLRLVALADVRRPAGEGVEEQAAERVHVRAGVHALAADLLGRDEVEGADPMPLARRSGFGQHVLREAEVRQVDVVALAEQHVRRLHVAMDEPGRVRGVERGRDLSDDRHSPGRGERALAADEGTHVVTRDEPHRDERHAVLFARVVHGDHVRVVGRGRRTRFAHEPAPHGGIVHQRGRDHLQCDRALQRELPRGTRRPSRRGRRSPRSGGPRRRFRGPIHS